MTPTIIPFAEGQKRLDWLTLVAALNLGHKGPKAKINDLFLYRGADTLLSRSAWIDGMGLLTKTATIFPGNSKSGQPMVGGGVLLFDRPLLTQRVLLWRLIWRLQCARRI